MNTTTERDTLTNAELENAAFVLLLRNHLKACISNGTFWQVQKLLKEQGFVITLHNQKKAKARKGSQ